MAEYLKSFKWELLLQMFTYLKIERVKQVRDGQGIELLTGGSPFLLSFFYNSVFSILLNLDQNNEAKHSYTNMKFKIALYFSVSKLSPLHEVM